MVRAMMNSSRARPTPAMGQPLRKVERLLRRSPTFIMHLDRDVRHACRATISSTVEFDDRRRRRSPNRPRRRTCADFLAVLAGASVASPQPTTAGMPSSRAMIAAWQVRPPRLVTIGAGALHDGFPVGIGHVGDQHIARRCTRTILEGCCRSIRTTPDADLLADRPTADHSATTLPFMR